MAFTSITRRALLAGLALSTALIAAPAFAEKVKIKIGFMGPLSGGNAQQGLGAKNGFLLAIEQANADPNGKFEIEPVVLDDASDPQTGVGAAMKLVNDPAVVAATGHWNSPVALATMPVFSRFQTPLIIWGAISPAITEQNLPEITRVTPTLLTENKPLSDWIVKDLGAKKIAVIADTSDYGKANADAVNEYVPAAGGEVVSTDLLPVGSTDFRTILTTIKGKNVDGVYFGGVITEAGILAKQMKEVGLEKPMLGISGFYDPEFISVAGDAASNAIVSYPTAAQTPKLVKMEADYQAKGFAEPMSPYTKFAFDAANIIIQAANEVGVEDKAKLAEAIRAIKYDGATGEITFDANGQTQTPVAIELKTVKDGQWTTYVKP